MDHPAQLKRQFRLFDAVCLAVGSAIGSGIFLVLSTMGEWVQTPGLLIGVWAFGGLFTILAAMAYAELSGMMPTAGGQCDFVREAFGEFWGFMFGWALFIVMRTGSNAAVAIAFAKYLGVLAPVFGEKNVLMTIPLGFQHLEVNSAQLLACGMIALLTAVNVRGTREGVFVQNVSTILKVAALAFITVVGLTYFSSGFSHFFPLIEPALGPKAVLQKAGFLAALAVALSQVLFAYENWYLVTFVGEEVHDAQRNLPKALLLTGFGLTAIYVLANVAYLAVLPIGEITAVAENRVAVGVAEILFGPIGSTLVIVAILVSIFGCLNGQILSGGRTFYAMARDGLFFRRCADLHPKNNTPAAALVVQGAWSILLTLTGSFSQLLTYVMFASVLFGGLTVVALYRLRFTQPDRPRPYRCWGYPVTPALYLAIWAWFLFYVILADPRATGIGVLFMLTGVPFYLYWRAKRLPGND